MASMVENPNPDRLNGLKWLLIAILILAGIIANQYFATQPLALRLGGWLVLGCVVLVIAYFTVQGKQFWAFTQEARTELRKVVWPTRQETTQTTLVVIGMVVIMGLFLWGLDSLIMWIIGLIAGTRG